MKEYSFGKGSILHHPPQLIIRFLADLASFNSLQDAGNYGSGLRKFHIFCDIFSIPEQKQLPAAYDLLHSFVLWATTDPELVDNSIIEVFTVPPHSRWIPDGFHIIPHGFHIILNGFHVIPHYSTWIPYYSRWIPHYFTWIPHYSRWIPHYSTWTPHYFRWIPYYFIFIPYYFTWIPCRWPNNM